MSPTAMLASSFCAPQTSAPPFAIRERVAVLQADVKGSMLLAAKIASRAGACCRHRIGLAGTTVILWVAQ